MLQLAYERASDIHIVARASGTCRLPNEILSLAQGSYVVIKREVVEIKLCRSV
jgi:hypothetical protein